MHGPLGLTLLLLASAVLGVVVFRSLQLPPMLGYLAVGILIGPHAFAVVPDKPSTRYLAEFGVVFLMFSIGLEFNLSKLRAMKRLVFGLGGSQVLLTMLLAVPTSFALRFAFPLSWQAALALGGALAMSSTAIVTKMMADRLELETEHGRNVMGILLFQDLAVVPLLILIPSLGKNPKDMALALGLASIKVILALTLILFVGQKIMSRWFHIVAARRSQELFMLNLLLITLGLAALTEHLGLSLALGAFLAGMLISETPYRHQVEEDIKPFRDVLLGLFFITIGMLLNIKVVMSQWFLVGLLLIGPIVFKFLVILGLTRVFGSRPGVSIRTGLALAQAGEFGFVLLNQIDGLNLVDDVLIQAILASMLLSMLLAPFMIQHAERIALRFAANEWMFQSLAVTQIAARSIQTEKHAIICGFGRSGQAVARMFDEEKIRYIALDMDPDRVRTSAAAGDSVVYGDAARREALVAAGISRAAVIVISYANTASALKVLHHVHELAPAVPVVVRTIDDSDLKRLKQAGATEVVPEIIEGSLMVASHALALLGVPFKRVVRRVQAARDARYGLLRGYFQGQTDIENLDQDDARLSSLVLTPSSAAVGQVLGEQGLEQIGVEVISVRRQRPQGDFERLQLDAELLLQVDDILVLCGTAEALAAAEQILLLKA
jgi:monovalent cation:H+ antiporter-2, CPA2 family